MDARRVYRAVVAPRGTSNYLDCEVYEREREYSARGSMKDFSPRNAESKEKDWREEERKVFFGMRCECVRDWMNAGYRV